MVKSNILKIKKRISAACSKINTAPNTVTIVAVSKGRAPEQIDEAIEAGIIDIGENRIQESLIKYNAIRNTQYAQRIKWHMVGHLQTNKVKAAVKIFGLIQSVDSARLAFQINKQAARINKIQDILMEINTSGEVSKFGIKPDDAVKVIKEIAQFKNISIKGLMTVAPVVDNAERARLYFRKLRVLLEEVNAMRITQYPIQILSMGMTDDFEVAIEEGSNMLRLGRAIFDGL